jgi:DNA-binding protein YbaB
LIECSNDRKEKEVVEEMVEEAVEEAAVEAEEDQEARHQHHRFNQML